MALRLLGAAALVGLAACATAPRPLALPALAADAASSVVATSLSPDSEAETAQAAAAFARTYFERLNLAYQRRDLSLLAGLTDPRCRSCANFAGDIRAMISAGHFLVGDSFDVISSDAPPVEHHEAVVNLFFRSPGVREYQSSGAWLLTRPATAGQVYLVELLHGTHGWQVREVAKP